MVTRRKSIENFSAKADELIGCAYLLSSARISAMLKSIASSRLLLEIVTYCLDGVDFESLLQEYSMQDKPYPTNDVRVLIAFGFYLFTAIDSGEFKLIDILNNNYKRSNLERSYQAFCTLFVIPFKDAIVDTAEKAAREYDAEVLNEKTKKKILARDKQVDSDEEEYPSIFVRAEEKAGAGRKNYLTCYSDIQNLVADDLAKIAHSRLREREKTDLALLLTTFRDCLFRGSEEQVKQSFISYKYAVQNFKRLDSSVDDIGRILRFCGIID
ncbi:MAG: hypothetical protein SO373_08665 [Candidatus Borkfalkiaceae bacterium]|nr:hypothetical protein [Christensenellaceae bacterium]